MMTLAPIHMRIRRLPSGSFALYGETEQANAVPGYMLRKLLFAWHERSFYGTGLEVTRTPNGDAIMLSPAMALDYLLEPGVLLHSSLTWEDGFTELQKGALFLNEAIEAGWYLPSYELWREGKNGWKFKVPVGQTERFRDLCNGAFPESFWQSWFSRIVEEMLETEADFKLSSVWNRLVQEHKLLQVNARGFEALLSESSWMQEEDWLLAIGWTHDDDAPYRICVQLVEPYAETYVDGTTTSKDNAADWRLRFIAQDRKDANRFVEFSSTGNVLVGEIPLAWQSDIADKIYEQTKRVLRMLPELESAYQPGKIIEQLSDEAAWTFLTESSLQLVAAGISVFLPSWWEEIQKMGRPQLKAKIKSSVGSTRKAMFGMDQIMQFDWRVALGGVDLSEEEFGQLALEKKRLIYIRGKWVQLDPAYLEQIRDAMKQVERKKGLSFRDVLEMHLSEDEEGLAADSDEKDKAVEIKIELNTHLRGLMKQLGQTKSIPLVERIDGLHAELRPYQVQGVSWLLFLRNMGLGGCLADDMGLGKTIQFIAYLLKVREQGETEVRLTGDSRSKSKSGLRSKPSLLICPTSVLGNWQKELARFAPTLQIQLHYGAQRVKGEAFEASLGDADLVITSYTLAQLDEEELSSVTWDTLCLDEAQNIKNAYTKQSQAIRKLEAGQRIALTGTPIENRLTELWSIFDFVNPGYLGTLTHFNRQYVGPIEKNGDGANELTARVQRLIRPFLLRRLKKDPAIQLDLPDKYEGKAYVRLTTEQGALYENVVQSLMEKIEESSGIEKKGLILTSLMKLKQICDHPGLFLKEIGGAGAKAGVRKGRRESKRRARRTRRRG
jgi:hypothetical protein